MAATMLDLIKGFATAEPRPGLHPIPGSTPLTLEAMICPPMLYYLALLFLPPPPPDAIDSVPVKLLRNLLALAAGLLFFRLPLAYHVPQSIGLTYQLGLVGLYGGARVLDAFILSPYLFNHIPRRVRYRHEPRVETPRFEGFRDVKSHGEGRVNGDADQPSRVKGYGADDGGAAAAPRAPQDGAVSTGRSSSSSSTTTTTASQMIGDVYRRGSLPTLDESYFLLSRTLSGPAPVPVTEHAVSEDGWPHSFLDRASWALELELSMRGVGFTWSTADVRHTRKTWLPTVGNRLHSICAHVLPILGVCFVVIRGVHVRYLQRGDEKAWQGGRGEDLFDTRLDLPLQLILTAALGAFLMAAFSFAHSAFAIVCSPLAPGPLAYFPPLYTTRIWNVRSVRGFWSYGWHRLFARFFLVYGVWPGEWLERRLTGKGTDEQADLGKVLGGFLSSAFCHSFAVRGVLAGEWRRATGEAIFFAINGVAVVVEGAVCRFVMERRRKKGGSLERWYDGWVGRIWWIGLLLYTGRNFARGWVNAGLVREMSAM